MLGAARRNGRSALRFAAHPPQDDDESEDVKDDQKNIFDEENEYKAIGAKEGDGKSPICDDLKIVLAAIGNDPRAFQYASKNLQDDEDVTLAAVRRDGRCLKYASVRLRMDRNFVLECIEHCGNGRGGSSNGSMVLRQATAALRSDPGLIQAAQANHGSVSSIPSPFYHTELDQLCIKGGEDWEFMRTTNGEYESQDDEDSVEEDEEKDEDDDEDVTFNLDVDTDGGVTDQDRYEAYLAEQSLTKKDVSTYASWLLKAKEIGT